MIGCDMNRAEAPAPLVTIVIPVVDEWSELTSRLKELPRAPEVALIVAPYGELPPAPHLLRERPDVIWRPGACGRAAQMNRGAEGARGKWLLFLHVDTQLPDGWIEELRLLTPIPDIVGGSFQFGLASNAWQARALEFLVARRTRLLDLPYGDQALFVRQELFVALGGFRPVPLMEDVEFVRRMASRGRLHHSRLAVRTSARRWEREGWFRRSARNLWLLAQYAFGANPEALARQYERGTSHRAPLGSGHQHHGNNTRL
jgi:rSAM/selenodomain-associated transferase 2